MNNVEAVLTYNSNLNSNSASAWSLFLSETTEEVTGVLAQNGPMYNGIVNYVGVFADDASALDAVIKNAGRFVIVERWSVFSEPKISNSVFSFDSPDLKKASAGEGYEARIRIRKNNRLYSQLPGREYSKSPFSS